MRALLDVNVLIALHDRDHVHHRRATDWFAANAKTGWASCPLTQNGCLRIMSQPAYPSAQPLAVLLNMLRKSASTAFHEFWRDDASILDAELFHQAHMHSHRQITDLYLLGLAIKNGGRLVSFDIRIPLTAVNGATQAHLVTP
ncbi:MAG: TA system VapC family ribonuclease toxin [Pseudomonadota bacterium]